MKRILNIILLLLAVGAFNSCKNEIIMFDESMNFVAFTSKTAAVGETGQTVDIPVLVTATAGSPAIEVSYTVSSEGHANPAIEGSDFKITSASSLSFPDGYGYNTITVETIDNDVFTGTKTFSIILTSNSLSYDFGSIDTIDVSISDDDHPFGWMLGDYSCTGNLWRAGGVNTWDITLNPVANDIYSVEIIGLLTCGGYPHPATSEYAFYGKIAEVDGGYEFSMLVGQEIPTFGYGPCVLEGWAAPDYGVQMETGPPNIAPVLVDCSSVSLSFADQYGILIFEGNNAGIGLEYTDGTVWTRK